MKPLIQELDRAIERGWANCGHLAAMRELALEAANEPEGHAPQAPPAAVALPDAIPQMSDVEERALNAQQRDWQWAYQKGWNECRAWLIAKAKENTRD